MNELVLIIGVGSGLSASLARLWFSKNMTVVLAARKIDKLMEGIEKRAYNLAKKYEQRYNTNKTSKA